MLSAQLSLVVFDFGYDLSPEYFQLSHTEPLYYNKQYSFHVIPRLRQKTKYFYEIYY